MMLALTTWYTAILLAVIVIYGTTQSVRKGLFLTAAVFDSALFYAITTVLERGGVI